MANEVRYGQVEGPGLGREYPVAASQYFHRRGGKFVYISSGNINLAASGTTRLLGWAEVPKHTAGQNSWASSATAGADKAFVIYDHDAVFEIPFHGTPTTSNIGAGVGIINATIYTSPNMTANAGTKQFAVSGTTATPLNVVDIDADNKTVFVKIKPSHRQ